MFRTIIVETFYVLKNQYSQINLSKFTPLYHLADLRRLHSLQSI